VNFSDKVFDKIMASEDPFEIMANYAAHKHVRSEKTWIKKFNYVQLYKKNT